MYAQRPESQTTQPIRKISPRTIASDQNMPLITSENWAHLVNIVTQLVNDKKIKDRMVSDLATRMSKVEVAIDHAPVSDTFTMKNVPPFLRGRIRRSHALVSKLLPRSTRHSSYRLTFHQYLGVPGLGIGVSCGKSAVCRPQAEEILFLPPAALEILAKSVAGEKERKLPDVLLKSLRLEKREFVRDWMKGYINLEKDDEEFTFSVDSDRCDEKDIWIEYVGTFDGMGALVGENQLFYKGVCGDKVNLGVSRMDILV